VVTSHPTVPIEPDGVVTVAVVGLFTLKKMAGCPRRSSAPSHPQSGPVTVTVVPPVLGPEVGLTR